jgi:hypothetical protein
VDKPGHLLRQGVYIKRERYKYEVSEQVFVKPKRRRQNE